MTKFKVGDVVVGNQDNVPNCVEQGQLYEVLATEPENGRDYIKTDLHPEWVLSERFNLYKEAAQVEQDDPLPPAPESVRYYHRGYGGIHADAYLDVYSGHFASGPNIRISDKDNRGITVDANTALQLAHNLNRMAMEIKRKGKQND